MSHFELKAKTHVLFKDVTLKNGAQEPMQSFGFDEENNVIYTLHGEGEGGDLWVSRIALDKNGHHRKDTPVTHMKLLGCGHGVSMGVQAVNRSESPWIWTECHGKGKGKEIRGTKLMRFRWHSGKHIHGHTVKSDPKPGHLDVYDPIKNASRITCAIDPVHEMIAVRYHLKHKTHNMLSVYELSSFAQKNYNQKIAHELRQPDAPPGMSKWFQGYTLFDENIYFLYGESGKGAVIQRMNIHKPGNIAESARESNGSEAEGMAIQVVSNKPRLCFGFSHKDKSGYVASVFYKEVVTDERPVSVAKSMGKR